VSLDAPPSRGQTGRARPCKQGLRLDHPSDAQKNELKPWLVKTWCIPPKANGKFVWKMEDVFEVYKRPCDPLRPVVCMDETSKQLIGETRLPVDAKPGQPRRVDYKYERKGVADLFMFFEPPRGWR
jgi:hypothetical protein